jgi:hypothetical protein
MESVDVKQVDGAVAKSAQCFVKGAAQERGELWVIRLIIRLHLLIDALIVVSGLIIPLPGIDGVGGGIESQSLDGLTKGEVGMPVVGTQLHKERWLESLYDPECKGKMLDPSRTSLKIIRPPKHGAKGEGFVLIALQDLLPIDSLERERSGLRGSDNKRSRFPAFRDFCFS